jgi:hypothetical protein
MLSAYDLIQQVTAMSPRGFADRFDLYSETAAQHQRTDFILWVRNCLTLGRKFATLDDAHTAYINSFGLPDPDEKESRMHCVLDLLHKIMDMSPRDFAERFGLDGPTAGHYQRMGLDNWLRNCLTPGRKFTSLEEAYGEYVKSFG